jgi:hypothetical protein
MQHDELTGQAADYLARAVTEVVGEAAQGDLMANRAEAAR